MSDADPAIAPGMTIGTYQIEHQLGSGAMGAVYAALEPTIKKRVAIKVMRRLFADDPAMAARFEREARAANDVRHPGIVDVFGFGKLPDGRPYLVMSLLEGRSLRDELGAREKLPPLEAWRITREIGEALAAAHEAGIVHRDLKPDNVFLERVKNRPARARVLDFGIAKVLEQPDDGAPVKLTQTGAPMGTPLYMAPEQWWGQAVDARTDQYALGVMLFEMLAGRLPFASKQFMELAHAHTHEVPPALGSVGIATSPGVEALVARALAKTPEERFATIDALLEAGDAAFGAGASPPAAASLEAAAAVPTPLALAATSAATGAGATGRVAPVAGLGRYVAVHFAVLIGGIAGLAAVGYAGEARYDLPTLFLQAGSPIYPTLLAFLIGAIALPLLALRRARDGGARRWAVGLSILPAIFGATGTYGDWGAVGRALDVSSSTARFAIFNEGQYEANTPRFVGLALASLLSLSLGAMNGVGPRATPAPGTSAARAIAVALAAVVVIGAIASAVVGAPSGALVGAVALAAMSLDLVIPCADGGERTKNQIERATLGLLAVLLMSAVALTRVEARACSTWIGGSVRALRLGAIVAARDERFATIGVSLLAIAALVAAAAVRLSAPARRREARPGWSTWALIGAVVAGLAGDFAMNARFAARGEAIRVALAPQFSLFARLDPPSGEGLSDRLAPHEAPALQIAREAVAVNGAGVAPIASVASGDGLADVKRALNAARASALAHEREPGAPDLALYVDREVPWSTVLPILAAARREGVRTVEILLSRGGRFTLPDQAPAEAAYVLPTDFFALPAELGEDGASFAGDRRFGDVAPALVEALRRGPGRVAIAAR